jgi:hypothetical protein
MKFIHNIMKLDVVYLSEIFNLIHPLRWRQYAAPKL